MPDQDHPSQDAMLKLVPEWILRKMAKAVETNNLGLLVVVAESVLQDLNANKTAVLELGDGGVMVLIPQKSVEALYADKGDAENDKN
jgi:hypothetical protein